MDYSFFIFLSSGLFLGWSLGANDAANIFGTAVGTKMVRFRTLGCYPLTGGCESTATTLDEIIDETLAAVSSERTTRVIDNEAAGSMERRKREGYF